MSTKEARQAGLLRLLKERPVRNQTEMVAWLREQGFDATQASVSRDVRELGLIKAGGRYIWSDNMSDFGESAEKSPDAPASRIARFAGAPDISALGPLQRAPRPDALVASEGKQLLAPKITSNNFGLITSITVVGANLLVVRTRVGAASIVAADLDHVQSPDIVGTLAGDDTIFIAVASRVAQGRVHALLRPRPRP